ncbi:hypothetical protein KAI92_00190 [Candidatus Parcubacteria bacterium]|nr:hypothetical protein [Candidatus Parcubacteria bacterium]
MSEQKIFQEPKWFSYIISAMNGIGIGAILTVLFCYVFGYSETIQLAQNNLNVGSLYLTTVIFLVFVLITIVLSSSVLSDISALLFIFNVICINIISYIIFRSHIMLAGLFVIYFMFFLVINSYFESLIKKGMKKYYLTIIFIIITLSSILYVCPFVYELRAEYNIAQAEFLLSGAKNGEIKVSSIKEADWLLKHLYFQEPDEVRKSFSKQTRSNYSNEEHEYYLIIPKTEYPVHLFSGHIDKEVAIRY